MSKKIKVPYEYESQFFGNSKKYRWFEVTVDDNVTPKTFIQQLMPHSTTVARLLAAEMDCAEKWLDAWTSDPRPMTRREVEGLLTILDQGVPDFVKAHGGRSQAFLDCLQQWVELPDEESVMLAVAAIEKLEKRYAKS